MHTVYSSDSALIQLSEKHKLLCLSWHAHTSPDKLWALISTFMRLTSTLHIENLLIDASDSDRQDFDKAKLEAFVSTLANTKVQKIARIVSKDIYVESTINTFLSQANHEITFRFFSNDIEGLQWLIDKEPDDLKIITSNVKPDYF